MKDKKNIIRLPVEEKRKNELETLKSIDKSKFKPQGWELSPKEVKRFILGDTGKKDGNEFLISKKFFGDPIQIERIIASLASDRAVLLIGEPGTAKSYLSEHLSAAISGISTNTIQGSAATTEDSIKYSWNYAMLLSKGPTEESLVPAPLYLGMKNGWITRFEEVTRCPSEIQDVLISVLSEKLMTIPELPENNILMAEKGFNVISTANTRDRGVNEMSSALKRRFNFELISPLKNLDEEISLVNEQLNEYLKLNQISHDVSPDVVELLVTTFSELRNGETSDGKKVDRPSITMSTAECVDTAIHSALHSHYFDEKPEKSAVIALKGVIKDNIEDLKKLQLYFDVIVEKKGGKWKKFLEYSKKII